LTPAVFFWEMSRKAIRTLLTVVILGGALTLLLFTTLKEGAQYYLHVDEVMASPQQWYGKPLQLHGFVVTGSVLKKPDSLDYRFDVQNGNAIVKASYTGVVPDTFKGGSEVVLTGRLGPSGFAVAPDGVMAKCPSKYQPAGGSSGTSGR
jgi:cytochrome c-type biogenesis protein CcmE